MPEVGADPRVQPLGHPLGGLHAEAVDEQLLGELAVGLELAPSARSPRRRP